MSSIAAYQTDRETEILSASPLELVEMLYKAAIDTTEKARRHLLAGEIRERSQAISKASAILAELAQSLDHEKGGEISKNLTELYDYMQRLLAKANIEQIEPPLTETARLMKTLLEGWQTCMPVAPVHPSPNWHEEGYVAVTRNF